MTLDHLTPPADRLRAAANLLRQRATAATPPADPYPGGWSGFGSAEPLSNWSAIYGGPAVEGYRNTTVMSTDEHCNDCQAPSPEDVQYIATVHPGVGLALADLLDGIAMTMPPLGSMPLIPWQREALAVADAILGIPAAKALTDQAVTG